MLKREMNIADYDAELWQAMEQEVVRQEEHIELSHQKTIPARVLCRLRALS